MGSFAQARWLLDRAALPTGSGGFDVTHPSPLLALDGVDLVIDGRAILRGITVQSDACRIAVLGRNGSGKSTLARVIAGLVPSTGGEVRVAGVDVARDRRAALGAVGILFQNPDHQIIFPTVGEELAFGLLQMGQTKVQAAEGVADTLAAFGKGHWHDAAIHTLSQGQRQLVCLMAILAMRPKLILLDEPFAGLDIPTALHLTRVLARVEAGIVHITHDPRTIAAYDHALWIDEGAVVAQGPAVTVAGEFEARMQEIGARDDLAHISG